MSNQLHNAVNSKNYNFRLYIHGMFKSSQDDHEVLKHIHGMVDLPQYDHKVLKHSKEIETMLLEECI